MYMYYPSRCFGPENYSEGIDLWRVIEMSPANISNHPATVLFGLCSLLFALVPGLRASLPVGQGLGVAMVGTPVLAPACTCTAL